MSVETYAKRNGKLHPTVRRILQPYFPELKLDSVKVQIVDYAPWTTIWAMADQVIVLKGKLNYEYVSTSEMRDGKLWHRGNGALDLSTPAGIQVLSHELKHCEQWRNTSRRIYWLWYIPGLLASWISGRYAHKFFRWEREAIAFQKTVKLTEREFTSLKLLQ